MCVENKWYFVEKKDIKKNHELLKNLNGIEPTAFTYPLGYISKEASETIIDLGYKASFSCDDRFHTIIKGNYSSLYAIKRFNRSGNEDSLSFFTKNNIKN